MPDPDVPRASRRARTRVVARSRAAVALATRASAVVLVALAVRRRRRRLDAHEQSARRCHAPAADAAANGTTVASAVDDADVDRSRRAPDSWCTSSVQCSRSGVVELRRGRTGPRCSRRRGRRGRRRRPRTPEPRRARHRRATHRGASHRRTRSRSCRRREPGRHGRRRRRSARRAAEPQHRDRDRARDACPASARRWRRRSSASARSAVGFDAVDDLKQVRGIGEGRFADIRDLVTRVMRHPAAGPVFGVGALVAGILVGRARGRSSSGPHARRRARDRRGRVARRRRCPPSWSSRSRSMLLGGAVMQRALDGLPNRPSIARSHGPARRPTPCTCAACSSPIPTARASAPSALVRADDVRPDRAGQGDRRRRRPPACARGRRPRRLRGTARSDPRRRLRRPCALAACRGDARRIPDRRVHTGAVAASPGSRTGCATACSTAPARSTSTHARSSPASFSATPRGIPADVDRRLPRLRALASARRVGRERRVRARSSSHRCCAGCRSPVVRLPRSSIVVCFAAATRFEPSVLRASALATVTILATFVGRPVAPLRGARARGDRPAA